MDEPRSQYQKAFRDRDLGAPVGRSYIPYRPFFWTLDQIATMTATRLITVKDRWAYYDGRSTGVRTPKRLHAINFATEIDRPDWRVEDKEFRRWLIHKGIRLYAPEIGRVPATQDPTSNEPDNEDETNE
jgi:hypothetical protein